MTLLRHRYGPKHRRFNNPCGSARRLFRTAALAVTLILVTPFAAVASDLPVVVAFGDSLTAGYGVADSESFPSRLAAALAARGSPVRMVNAGVSGDTTAGGRARLDWMLADRPDVVIVELGANDGLRGVDPTATRDNLDAILARLQAESVTVLLAGMLAPPNLGREYGEAFNAVFPTLADKYDVIFYPFFLEGVAAEPKLNQADGIHPNAEGVEVIVAGILPYVMEALERAGAQ